MQVEVKVLRDYDDKKMGDRFVTDTQTASDLMKDFKVAIVRNVPSHTMKKEVSHIPKKKY